MRLDQVRWAWRAGLLVAVACLALVQLMVAWSRASATGLSSARSLLVVSGNDGQISEYAKKEPAAEYEQRRRRLKNGIHEFWYYMSSELRKMQRLIQENPALVAFKIDAVLDLGDEHKMTLLTDFDVMLKSDGYNSWREGEAAELSDLVQRRLFFLQNPPSCAKARKLVCSLNKRCSIGCLLHHVVYCFIVAYGTQRTLILKSRGWMSHPEGWEDVFQPLSNVCLDGNGVSHSEWPGKEQTQVVYLPAKEFLSSLPSYLPMAVPADLAPRLTRLHGNPPAWWVGQFLKYMLRPQKRTAALIHESSDKMGFEMPIVGVYIGQAEKERNGYYPTEMYMEEVEKYFDIIEHSHEGIQRRIYLATDNRELINETILQNHHYEVLCNKIYDPHALEATIIDIHFLSHCDYLVCAFSSSLCRVAYELMQSLHPDAADRFHSMDELYYFDTMSSNNQEAIYPHYGKILDELDLRVGDQIKVGKNYWNGSSDGESVRLKKSGLYPSFKVMGKVQVADFPIYPEVPLKSLSQKPSKLDKLHL